MEEHVTLEAVPVEIAAGFLDHLLDAAVESLGGGVAQMVTEVGDDVVPVLLEHPHDFLDRFQSGRHRISERSNSFTFQARAVFVIDSFKALKRPAHLRGIFSKT